MHWSILIAGIPERYHSAAPLLASLLEAQGVARMPDVELLYLMDNRRRSVGAKRNDLTAAARGDYITFIDDDDAVSPEYVRRIYHAIRSARKSEAPADVICFPQRATLHPHGIIHECRYSLAYYREREPQQRRQLEVSHDAAGAVVPNTLLWTGPPAHTMAWRRALVADLRFPEQQFGEDVGWVDAACERAKSEASIDVVEPLYFYRYNSDTSATRGN